MPTVSTHRCRACGFESPDSGDWERVECPPLGRLTRCPECGSTDVQSL